MTAMSRALNQQFHPNTRRRWRAGSAVPWRAAGRREAHWVQIAESERQVTTLDPPPATTRLLIDFLKVIGAGKAEITTPQAADLLNVSPPYIDIGGLVDKVRCLHAWHAISGVRCGSTEGAARSTGPTFNDSRPAKHVRRQSRQHRLAQAEEQSVKFNCRQIAIQDQLSASVIGQVVAGARLVSRRHRSRSQTFASVALKAPIAVWMPIINGLKWAARLVRAREHTATFANADPEENP
jgi:hypothetical protein